MSRQNGLCLLEVLIATSLLATSSLFLIELNLWCQKEIRSQQQFLEVRQALLDRLTLARLKQYQNGVLFIPREISGVSFLEITQEIITEQGHKGNEITVTARWTDPHNIPRIMSFNALIAF